MSFDWNWIKRAVRNGENKPKTQSVIRSIRFTKEAYDALKFAAERSGVPFATYLKEGALAYMQAASQHEDLMLAINPDNPATAQKTFFDSLNEIRDVLSRTVTNNDQVLNKKIDRLQKFIEASVTYQMRLFPVVPAAGVDQAKNLAKERMQWVLGEVDRVGEVRGINGKITNS